MFTKNLSERVWFRAISFVLAFTFIFTSTITPAVAQVLPSVLNLPAVGAMVTPTNAYTPALIKGITIHPENPLQMDFIVSEGDDYLEGNAFDAETTKLVKYFLAALTTPEDEMWVNLSPYERDRIVTSNFGDTIMGRDLLAQDYLLKQLTSSLMYPEGTTGQEFWQRVRAKAQAKFGTTDIPMNTFNKIWIVPERAVIYTHQNNAFVVESNLKVMLEEDYLALERNQEKNNASETDTLTGVSLEIVREVLIPEIQKEINMGKAFAPLRQIYSSVILADWYKANLKESLLGQAYVDQAKTAGIDTTDKEINQKIYDQYLASFKQGVYDYIKEEHDPTTNTTIPRKYFSGGANLEVDHAMTNGTDLTETQQRAFQGDHQKVTVSLADEAQGNFSYVSRLMSDDELLALPYEELDKVVEALGEQLGEEPALNRDQYQDNDVVSELHRVARISVEKSTTDSAMNSIINKARFLTEFMDNKDLRDLGLEFFDALELQAVGDDGKFDPKKAVEYLEDRAREDGVVALGRILSAMSTKRFTDKAMTNGFATQYRGEAEGFLLTLERQKRDLLAKDSLSEAEQLRLQRINSDIDRYRGMITDIDSGAVKDAAMTVRSVVSEVVSFGEILEGELVAARDRAPQDFNEALVETLERRKQALTNALNKFSRQHKDVQPVLIDLVGNLDPVKDIQLRKEVVGLWADYVDSRVKSGDIEQDIQNEKQRRLDQLQTYFDEGRIEGADITTLPTVMDYVAQEVDFVKPDRIVVVNASDKEQIAKLYEDGLEEGIIYQGDDGNVGSHSHPDDTARAIGPTTNTSRDSKDSGFFNNWNDSRQVLVNSLSKSIGQYKGKTMYVLASVAGHPKRDTAFPLIQTTDNLGIVYAYLALYNLFGDLIGEKALEKIRRDEGRFLKIAHTTGDLDKVRRAGDATIENESGDFRKLREYRGKLFTVVNRDGNVVMANLKNEKDKLELSDNPDRIEELLALYKQDTTIETIQLQNGEFAKAITDSTEDRLFALFTNAPEGSNDFVDQFGTEEVRSAYSAYGGNGIGAKKFVLRLAVLLGMRSKNLGMAHAYFNIFQKADQDIFDPTTEDGLIQPDADGMYRLEIDGELLELPTIEDVLEKVTIKNYGFMGRFPSLVGKSNAGLGEVTDRHASRSRTLVGGDDLAFEDYSDFEELIIFNTEGGFFFVPPGMNKKTLRVGVEAMEKGDGLSINIAYRMYIDENGRRRYSDTWWEEHDSPAPVVQILEEHFEAREGMIGESEGWRDWLDRGLHKRLEGIIDENFIDLEGLSEDITRLQSAKKEERAAVIETLAYPQLAQDVVQVFTADGKNLAHPNARFSVRLENVETWIGHADKWPEKLRPEGWEMLQHVVHVDEVSGRRPDTQPLVRVIPSAKGLYDKVFLWSQGTAAEEGAEGALFLDSEALKPFFPTHERDYYDHRADRHTELYKSPKSPMIVQVNPFMRRKRPDGTYEPKGFLYDGFKANSEFRIWSTELYDTLSELYEEFGVDVKTNAELLRERLDPKEYFVHDLGWILPTKDSRIFKGYNYSEEDRIRMTTIDPDEYREEIERNTNAIINTFKGNVSPFFIFEHESRAEYYDVELPPEWDALIRQPINNMVQKLYLNIPAAAPTNLDQLNRVTGIDISTISQLLDTRDDLYVRTLSSGTKLYSRIDADAAMTQKATIQEDAFVGLEQKGSPVWNKVAMIQSEDSRNIFDALVANGFLNENGQRTDQFTAETTWKDLGLPVKYKIFEHSPSAIDLGVLEILRFGSLRTKRYRTVDAAMIVTLVRQGLIYGVPVAELADEYKLNTIRRSDVEKSLTSARMIVNDQGIDVDLVEAVGLLEDGAVFYGDKENDIVVISSDAAMLGDFLQANSAYVKFVVDQVNSFTTKDVYDSVPVQYDRAQDVHSFLERLKENDYIIQLSEDRWSINPIKRQELAAQTRTTDAAMGGILDYNLVINNEEEIEDYLNRKLSKNFARVSIEFLEQDADIVFSLSPDTRPSLIIEISDLARVRIPFLNEELNAYLRSEGVQVDIVNDLAMTADIIYNAYTIFERRINQLDELTANGVLFAISAYMSNIREVHPGLALQLDGIMKQNELWENADAEKLAQIPGLVRAQTNTALKLTQADGAMVSEQMQLEVLREMDAIFDTFLDGPATQGRFGKGHEAMRALKQKHQGTPVEGLVAQYESAFKYEFYADGELPQEAEYEEDMVDSVLAQQRPVQEQIKALEKTDAAMLDVFSIGFKSNSEKRHIILKAIDIAEEVFKELDGDGFTIDNLPDTEYYDGENINRYIHWPQTSLVAYTTKFGNLVVREGYVKRVDKETDYEPYHFWKVVSKGPVLYRSSLIAVNKNALKESIERHVENVLIEGEYNRVKTEVEKYIKISFPNKTLAMFEKENLNEAFQLDATTSSVAVYFRPEIMKQEHLSRIKGLIDEQAPVDAAMAVSPIIDSKERQWSIEAADNIFSNIKESQMKRLDEGALSNWRSLDLHLSAYSKSREVGYQEAASAIVGELDRKIRQDLSKKKRKNLRVLQQSNGYHRILFSPRLLRSEIVEIKVFLMKQLKDIKAQFAADAAMLEEAFDVDQVRVPLIAKLDQVRSYFSEEDIRGIQVHLFTLPNTDTFFGLKTYSSLDELQDSEKVATEILDELKSEVYANARLNLFVTYYDENQLLTITIVEEELAQPWFSDRGRFTTIDFLASTYNEQKTVSISAIEKMLQEKFSGKDIVLQESERILPLSEIVRIQEDEIIFRYQPGALKNKHNVELILEDIDQYDAAMTTVILDQDDRVRAVKLSASSFDKLAEDLERATALLSRLEERQNDGTSDNFIDTRAQLTRTLIAVLNEAITIKKEDIDSAMTAPGGIDLDPDLFQIETKGDGELNFPRLKPGMIPTINGLVPTIINVVPIPNLPFVLGLVDSESDTDYGKYPNMDPTDRKARIKAGDIEELTYLN